MRDQVPHCDVLKTSVSILSSVQPSPAIGEQATIFNYTQLYLQPCPVMPPQSSTYGQPPPWVYGPHTQMGILPLPRVPSAPVNGRRPTAQIALI